MDPPPAECTPEALRQWLENIGFVGNFQSLVRHFRQEVTKQNGDDYRCEKDHLFQLRYDPPTNEQPAKIAFSTAGVPILVIPRIERNAYTEWVLAWWVHNERSNTFELDGDHPVQTAYGPDFYREAHLRSDGALNHQGRKQFKLDRVQAPGRQLIMTPANPDLHRINPPFPLQELQHRRAMPTPSHRPLPPPPQGSVQSFSYVYRLGSGRAATEHAVHAEVTFFNPHVPQARSNVVHPHVQRIIGWNTRTEKGEEPGWEEEGRGFDDLVRERRTPSW
ncbi:hypothetical protein JCM11251_007634 [Rhodosporidiobolus azoricus]